MSPFSENNRDQSEQQPDGRRGKLRKGMRRAVHAITAVATLVTGGVALTNEAQAKNGIAGQRDKALWEMADRYASAKTEKTGPGEQVAAVAPDAKPSFKVSVGKAGFKMKAVGHEPAKVAPVAAPTPSVQTGNNVTTNWWEMQVGPDGKLSPDAQPKKAQPRKAPTGKAQPAAVPDASVPHVDTPASVLASTSAPADYLTFQDADAASRALFGGNYTAGLSGLSHRLGENMDFAHLADAAQEMVAGTRGQVAKAAVSASQQKGAYTPRVATTKAPARYSVLDSGMADFPNLADDGAAAKNINAAFSAVMRSLDKVAARYPNKTIPASDVMAWWKSANNHLHNAGVSDAARAALGTHVREHAVSALDSYAFAIQILDQVYALYGPEITAARSKAPTMLASDRQFLGGAGDQVALMQRGGNSRGGPNAPRMDDRRLTSGNGSDADRETVALAQGTLTPVSGADLPRGTFHHIRYVAKSGKGGTYTAVIDAEQIILSDAHGRQFAIGRGSVQGLMLTVGQDARPTAIVHASAPAEAAQKVMSAQPVTAFGATDANNSPVVTAHLGRKFQKVLSDAPDPLHALGATKGWSPASRPTAAFVETTAPTSVQAARTGEQLASADGADFLRMSGAVEQGGGEQLAALPPIREIKAPRFSGEFISDRGVIDLSPGDITKLDQFYKDWHEHNPNRALSLKLEIFESDLIKESLKFSAEKCGVETVRNMVMERIYNERFKGRYIAGKTSGDIMHVRNVVEAQIGTTSVDVVSNHRALEKRIKDKQDRGGYFNVVRVLVMQPEREQGGRWHIMAERQQNGKLLHDTTAIAELDANGQITFLNFDTKWTPDSAVLYEGNTQKRPHNLTVSLAHLKACSARPVIDVITPPPPPPEKLPEIGTCTLADIISMKDADLDAVLAPRLKKYTPEQRHAMYSVVREHFGQTKTAVTDYLRTDFLEYMARESAAIPFYDQDGPEKIVESIIGGDAEQIKAVIAAGHIAPELAQKLQSGVQLKASDLELRFPNTIMDHLTAWQESMGERKIFIDAFRQVPYGSNAEGTPFVRNPEFVRDLIEGRLDQKAFAAAGKNALYDHLTTMQFEIGLRGKEAAREGGISQLDRQTAEVNRMLEHGKETARAALLSLHPELDAATLTNLVAAFNPDCICIVREPVIQQVSDDALNTFFRNTAILPRILQYASHGLFGTAPDAPHDHPRYFDFIADAKAGGFDAKKYMPLPLGFRAQIGEEVEVVVMPADQLETRALTQEVYERITNPDGSTTDKLVTSAQMQDGVATLWCLNPEKLTPGSKKIVKISEKDKHGALKVIQYIVEPVHLSPEDISAEKLTRLQELGLLPRTIHGTQVNPEFFGDFFTDLQTAGKPGVVTNRTIVMAQDDSATWWTIQYAAAGIIVSKVTGGGGGGGGLGPNTPPGAELGGGGGGALPPPPGGFGF